MDVKRAYVDELLKGIDKAYDEQKEKIKKIAQMFYDCMDNMGVVQLFGHRLNEEFVNELNYRAGGLVPFHAVKAKEAAMRGLIKKELVSTGEFLNDVNTIEPILSVYEMDDRDMWCLVSINGNEPFVLELAKRAKAKGKKIVVITNMASYKANNGTLLEYADEYLDMGVEEPDTTVEINGQKYGQTGTSVGSVLAQMLTSDVYALFEKNKGSAPILLSSNVKGADEHNHELCIPYGKRVD